MLIDHSREKLLNLIAYFVKNTKKCQKTKLFKLLYFADFRHFKETGRSITGLKYYAWEKGPVPTALFEEMKQPKQDFMDSFTVVPAEDIGIDIIVKKPANMKHFTKREMKIIEDTAFIFKEAFAKDMVECTHLPNEPWSTTLKNKGKSAEIDYVLALDNTKESISQKEYEQREADFEEVKKALK
jgi:uncharacterized phage-associated protein